MVFESQSVGTWARAGQVASRPSRVATTATALAKLPSESRRDLMPCTPLRRRFRLGAQSLPRIRPRPPPTVSITARAALIVRTAWREGQARKPAARAIEEVIEGPGAPKTTRRSWWDLWKVFGHDRHNVHHGVARNDFDLQTVDPRLHVDASCGLSREEFGKLAILHVEHDQPVVTLLVSVGERGDLFRGR